MSLITRTEKGSKLTIAEMDGNLTYLESNGFVDGEYAQTLIGTGVVGSMSPQLANAAAVGVYENISPTGGSGTGLIVDVEVTAPGGRASLAANYIIVNGGSGYQAGDIVSIQNTDIGGTAGTIDRELFADDVLNLNQSSTIEVTPESLTITSADGNLTNNGSILGIANSSLDPISFNNGATGSYVISEPETSADGSGLEIELLIYGTSGISMSIDLTGSSVINSGSGYAAGDELYIYASQIGGTGEDDFITITLGEDDVIVIPYGFFGITPEQTSLNAGNDVGISLTPTKGISLPSDSTYIFIEKEDIVLKSPSIRIEGELNTQELILPTEDPGILGQIWVDAANGYVVKVSVGE